MNFSSAENEAARPERIPLERVHGVNTLGEWTQRAARNLTQLTAARLACASSSVVHKVRCGVESYLFRLTVRMREPLSVRSSLYPRIFQLAVQHFNIDVVIPEISLSKAIRRASLAVAAARGGRPAGDQSIRTPNGDERQKRRSRRREKRHVKRLFEFVLISIFI